MTRLLSLLLALFLLAPGARAHGGEDHGAGASRSTSGAGVMTTSALTRAYEVVLKHAPVRGGQPFRATLYLAFFETNLPVRGAQVTVEEPGVQGRPFTVRETGTPGVYAVERAAGFARDGRFNVTVRVAGSAGPALVLLQNVYVGPAPTPAPEAAPAEDDGGGVPWLWLVAVLVLGAGFAAWLVGIARQRRVHADEAGTSTVPDSAPPAPAEPPTPERAARPVQRAPTSTTP
jgi:hypothetical protein